MTRATFIVPQRPYPIEEQYNRGLTFTNGYEFPLIPAICANIIKNKAQSQIIDANVFRYTDEQIMEQIKQHNPDFVFISPNDFTRWQCPSFTIKWIIPIIKKIKEWNKTTKIVVYGAHATATPEWVKEKIPEADIIVKGELEAIIFDIVDNKQFPEDYWAFAGINTLPLPAYELLPMEEYKKKIKFFPVLSTRGCPFNCQFCFKFTFGGPTGKIYRERTVWNVIPELKALKKLGINHVAFTDWEFCLNRDRVIELCKEIKDLNIQWTINTRFTDLDYELLKTMKEAGLVEVKLGFESGSKTIIKNIKKDIDLDKVPQIKKWLDELGIKAFYYGIILSPGETLETLKESVKYSVKHGIGKGGGKICVPFPGTELHKVAEKQYGKKITWDDLPKVAGTIGTDLLKTHSVEDIYRRIYLQYLVEKINKKVNAWQ